MELRASVLVGILAGSLGNAMEQTETHKWRRPDQLVLANEHHNALSYYIRAVDTGILKRDSKAVVLHVDSHADMGVPEPFQGHWPAPPISVENFVNINDFLIEAVYLGIVGHIIFVEPPWGNQFRCCLRPNATYSVVVGTAKNGELKLDVIGGKGKNDRFGHIFWRNGERLAGQNVLKNKKAFQLSFVNMEDVGSALATMINPAAPLILDLDLDIFSTESPGAIRIMRDTTLSYEDLRRIYHIAWNFPAFHKQYFELHDSGLRARSNADDFVHQAEVSGANMNDDSLAFKTVLDAVVEAWPGLENKEIVASLLLKGFDRTDELEISDSMKDDFFAFLEQPFHIAPTNQIEYYVDLWEQAFSALPSSPAIIHVIQSPGYTPPSLLPLIQCSALNMLDRLIDGMPNIQHDSRVRPPANGSEPCGSSKFKYVEIVLNEVDKDEL